MLKRSGFILLVLILLSVSTQPVFATSKSAYQEYLIAFDGYRAGLNEFKVARSEYLKFKTLTSQQIALEKTKQMLVQRSQLLKSYLQFINEKLNEDTSLDAVNRTLYQSLIQNEVTFLNKHASLLPSIGSLQDAESVSQQLASHYALLQSNMYQTIVAIKVSELSALEKQYTAVLAKTQEVIQANRTKFTPEKQGTMDRWILQIQNKRDLFKQKTDDIAKDNAMLKSSSMTDIVASYQRIQKSIAEARQYLSEGSSFLQELANSMQYGE